MDANISQSKEDDSDDSDEENEEGVAKDLATNGQHKESDENGDTKEKDHGAYREFLQFLELGCYGSPVQGYPTILIIVSTIPPSVCSSPSVRQR